MKQGELKKIMDYLQEGDFIGLVTWKVTDKSLILVFRNKAKRIIPLHEIL